MFLFVLLLFISTVSTQNNQTIIWLGTFFSFNGTTVVGAECYPAVKIAIEEINNNTNILPNHLLSIMVNDSKCSPRSALQGAIWQHSQHPLTAIIGGTCSVESIPIALFSDYYSIPQISYSSTSPELSNKELYPYFSRVVPSDTFMAYCWIGILKYYGWKRIATLNSQESIHSLLVSSFLETVSSSLPDVEVLTSETFVGGITNPDMKLQLNNIKKKGLTIIFLSCYESDAAAVLNQASTLGMTSGDYVWVGTDSWITDQLVTFVDSFDLLLGVIGANIAKSNSSITRQLQIKYEALTSRVNYNVYVDHAYDCVYAIAKALHQLIEEEHVPFDPMFPTSSNNFGDRLLLAIRELTFSGASAGVVSFEENGDRNSSQYVIYDYRAYPQECKVAAAYWDILDGLDVVQPVVWADGSEVVPLDHLKIRQYRIDISIKIAMLFLAVLGMITVIVFMILVFIWKDQPRIHAATTLFLMIILFAALPAYSVVIVTSIEPVNNFTCIAPHWFGHIAFFLAFGSLFAKTFRVWQIFDSAKKLKKGAVKISDSMLLGVVFGFTLFGIVLLIIFTIVETPIPTSKIDETDTTLEYIQCHSPSLWTLLTLFVFELVSLFYGVFLSFKTRKIEFLQYNESTQIAVSIFALLFIGFIFLPICYFLSESLSPDMSFLISSMGIICGTSTLVLVLFIPKFRAIINGKTDSLSGTGTDSSVPTS